MPTQIHELKGVMTAESRGLQDGLEAIARWALRAAQSWDRAATQIDASVGRIEASVNRVATSLNGLGAQAAATAQQVAGSAAGMATAWNRAVSSMGGARPATTPVAAQGSRSTPDSRAAERQAAIADRLAAQREATAIRAADRAAATEARLAAQREATAIRSAGVVAATDERLRQQQESTAIRAADRQAAAAERATERQRAAAMAAANANRISASDVATAWVGAFDKVLSAAARVTTVITGTIGALGGTLIAIGTKFNDTITRADIALTKLTGSANISTAVLADLKKLAIESPSFKFGDLAPLAVSLINAKFAAKEVVPMIRLIGDQVAAIGGSQQTFDRIVLAITQIKQKGRFTAQEANQLAEAGISPWQAIADAMGKTVAEVRKMSELGRIDSQTALNAIFADMEKSAGAMKATATATVGGLISSVMDQFEQWAGKVTTPIYNIMRQSLSGLLSSLDSPEFAAFTQVAYAQFQRLANAIQGFFGSIGSDPWAAMSNGARRLTDAIVDGIGAFQRLLPTLLEVGQKVAAVVEWFARLAIEHPNWTAALVALQITGMLGLNAAIGAVIKALTSLVGWLLQTATGTTSAAAALESLAAAAGLSSAALGGIIAIAAAAFLYELVDALGDLNSQMTKAIDLQNKFRQSLEKQTKTGIEQAAAMGGEEQVKSLEEQLAAADKRSQDAKKAQIAAQKAADAADAKWFNATEREMRQANLSEAASVSAAAEEQYAAIQAELERVKTEQAKKRGEAEMAAKDVPLSMEVQDIIGQGFTPEEAAKRQQNKAAIDKSIENQKQKAIAKDAKSYDELREFMDLGPSTDELRQFAKSLPGFTDEVVDNLVKMFDEAKTEAAKNPEDVRAEWLKADVAAAAESAARQAQGVTDIKDAATAGKDRFAQSAEQLQLSGASKAVIDTAQSQFKALTDTLTDGTLSVDDYEKRVKELTKGMQNIVSVNPEEIQKRLAELSTGGAADAAFMAKFEELQTRLLNGAITVAQFKDGIGNLEKRLQTAGQAEQQFQSILDGVAKSLPSFAVDQLRMQFEQLQNGLINGAIGLDQFKEKMRQLDEQARMADLQRRAAGMFTIEEFQQAWLQKLAGIQQQIFGQKVDEAVVQQLLNAGLSLEQIAKLIGKLPDKFDKMLAQQKQQTQTVDSGWAQRTQTFYNWLGSFDGQVTSLRNQIALMSQNLAPGVLDTTRERLRYVDQIAQLNNQLNALLAPKTPIVRQTEADFLRDPNLGNNAGGTVVNVTMPQVRVDSASMAYEIGNAIANEQKRRGAAAYN